MYIFCASVESFNHGAMLLEIMRDFGREKGQCEHLSPGKTADKRKNKITMLAFTKTFSTSYLARSGPLASRCMSTKPPLPESIEFSSG